MTGKDEEFLSSFSFYLGQKCHILDIVNKVDTTYCAFLLTAYARCTKNKKKF